MQPLSLLACSLAWLPLRSGETCEPSSLLQQRKVFSHFRGTPNETKQKLSSVLSGSEPVYPYNVMTCAGEQALTTKSMTLDEYYEIRAKIQEQYDGLDSECHGMICPRAEYAGCVLRVAGHDFMDYKDGQGGADGCLDLTDPDNAGLADCIYKKAEFGVSIADAYASFCTKVSLADFFVIAANSMIHATRKNAVAADPSLKYVDLWSVFQYGRTTATKCPWSRGVLPNPEKSCSDVDRVFLKNMGLNWEKATALMGVHTLGRARIENSGYDGWWSDAENSNMFNNNYFMSLGVKGWVPEKKINGNENKNQWVRGDRGKEHEATTGKEMMLNTDMCLVWTNDDEGKVDLNAKTSGNYPWYCNCAWVGPGELWDAFHKQNHGKFCGSTDVPDDFRWGWRGQRFQCCGAYDWGTYVDCGDPRFPAGKAWEYVRHFVNDDNHWLKMFREAWKIATSNGQSGLKSVH